MYINWGTLTWGLFPRDLFWKHSFPNISRTPWCPMSLFRGRGCTNNLNQRLSVLMGLRYYRQRKPETAKEQINRKNIIVTIAKPTLKSDVGWDYYEHLVMTSRKNLAWGRSGEWQVGDRKGKAPVGNMCGGGTCKGHAATAPSAVESSVMGGECWGR